jgi:hypothetical protein
MAWNLQWRASEIPLRATAMPSMIDFSDRDASKIKDEIVLFNHRLAETGLFTDEALAQLLDEYPRDQVTICTMRENPPPAERWTAGDADGLSGAELVEAARRGRLWISPRTAMTDHPKYRAVFDKVMAEFAKETGVQVLRGSAAILISSARMGVFLHVDAAETMLWHVRGEKTMYVYPPKEELISERSLEAILLKETLSDLPYQPWMEDEAIAVALKPGEAVSWPIHSPHRVVNGDNTNVSVSVEYTTRRSMLKNGVLQLNGRLRRDLGLNPRADAVPEVLKPAYWLANKAWQKLAPPKQNALASHSRQFDVDLSAPNCIRWKPGFGPQVMKEAA